MAMPLRGTGMSPDRLLGVEHSTAEGYGPIVVRDGLGGEISIPSGERRAFDVKLDVDSCFYWRCADPGRTEGFPVIERMRITWRETNYIQVTRDAGRGITWACYERRIGKAAEPGTADSYLSPLRPSASPAGPRRVSPAGRRSPRARSPRARSPRAASPRPAVRVAAQPAGVPAAPEGAGVAHRPSGLDAEWASASVDAAVSAAKEFLGYVEEAPRRLSFFCMLGGAAIALNGALDVLDVFEVIDHVIIYTVNLYMVFFGLVTCVTEANSETTPQLYDAVRGLQAWMHNWAKGLTTLWGRGLFHIFQGTLAVLSSGSMGFGIAIGLYMMVMGIIYLNLHFRAPSQRQTQEDYIRINN